MPSALTSHTAHAVQKQEILLSPLTQILLKKKMGVIIANVFHKCFINSLFYHVDLSMLILKNSQCSLDKSHLWNGKSW